jgi:hypothetical protein
MSSQFNGDQGMTVSTIRPVINVNHADARDYLIEINRAEDFTSDDSLFFTATGLRNISGAGANGGNNLVVIGGLPSGTPWFIRASDKTTGEKTVGLAMIATWDSAPVSTYAGYSIDKALLMVPDPIIEIASPVGAFDTGYPPRNLLRDDPSSIARFSRSDVTIMFTTSGKVVNTLAILGTLLNDDATWNIQAFTDRQRTNMEYQTGNVPFRCSPTLNQRQSYHGVSIFPELRARFWTVTISAPGASMVILRNLIIGYARMSANADKGASYGANDLGSASRTRFGVLDAVRGWRGKIVSFAMSWLSETEFQKKWGDLPGLVGTTKSVLAIPNSKRNIHLNDRIAFGNITQMGAENVQSFKYSQSIEINSIY